MKKISFFILIFFCFIPPFSVYAEENVYYRVVKENAPLYETETSTEILFYLPYTYYVQVLGETADRYKIKIYGENDSPFFIGYTEKKNLFLDNLTVVSPFPSVEVKTCLSSVLYTDISLENKQMYIFSERTFIYYGFNFDKDGNVLYLIGDGENIGYIKENALYPFSVPVNPNPLTFLEDNEKTVFSSNGFNDGEYTLLKIGIILCLIIAGGLALYVAIRKKEKPKTVINYYDENDYE